MIHTLAIGNYRSLLNLTIPLQRLNVVTGANGCGKSNLYRALRLLAETAQGGVINALAKEGGLQSSFWAGPENISRRMKSGEVKVEGTVSTQAQRLRLGFSSDDFGYSISLGLPPPPRGYPTAFSLDPEIKRECIWAGEFYRQNSCLIDRTGVTTKIRNGRSWDAQDVGIEHFDSVLSELSDPSKAPEIFSVRERIKSWRFYDHFRTDHESMIRQAQIGTRTPVLSHNGHDLAAAIQTIYEIGNKEAFNQAIEDAFPGADIKIAVSEGSRFSIEFKQYGLLRPLSGAELSDGTLRYILLVAALLTPRAPSLMVLNEPETSLHPELLPALAKLIIHASKHSQMWIVSHSDILVKALGKYKECNLIELEKELGQTQIIGQTLTNAPPWNWPDKK